MKFFRSSRFITCLGFLCGAAFVAGLTFALPALAQTETPFQTFGREAGFSTQDNITIIIARLIRTFLSLLGIIAVVLIIYGGFLWMTASGEARRIETAKTVLKNAVI